MTEVTVIPGEMRLWTDLSGSGPRPVPASPVSVALVDMLLGRIAGSGRVLVAGPHGHPVLAAVARANCDAAVLVRSLADAEQIASAHPGLDVSCGGFAAFEAAPFDLIIALDGVERLSSVDDGPTTWIATLRKLTSLLTARGTLVFSWQNLLSPQRLAHTDGDTAQAAANPWLGSDHVDVTRPSSPDHLREEAAAWGLEMCVLAGAPFATDPDVLVREDRARGPIRDARLLAALEEGGSRLRAGQPQLFDPTPHLVHAARGGRWASAAPGWTAVLARSVEASELPEALWSTGAYGVAGLVVEKTATDESDHVRWADQRAATGPGEWVTRELDHYPVDPVPHDTLANALRRLSGQQDFSSVRSTVAGYLRWVGDRDSAEVLVPANVVVLDGGFAVLDPSVVWSAGMDAASAVGLGALMSAEILLSGVTSRHWPPWLSAEDLARALVDDVVPRGVEVDWDQARTRRDAVSPAEAPKDQSDAAAAAAALAESRRQVESLTGLVEAHDRLERIRAKQVAKLTEQTADLKQQLAAARRNALEWKRRAVAGPPPSLLSRAKRRAVGMMRTPSEAQEQGGG